MERCLIWPYGAVTGLQSQQLAAIAAAVISEKLLLKWVRWGARQ